MISHHFFIFYSSFPTFFGIPLLCCVCVYEIVYILCCVSVYKLIYFLLYAMLFIIICIFYAMSFVCFVGVALTQPFFFRFCATTFCVLCVPFAYLDLRRALCLVHLVLLFGRKVAFS